MTVRSNGAGGILCAVGLLLGCEPGGSGLAPADEGSAPQWPEQALWGEDEPDEARPVAQPEDAGPEEPAAPSAVELAHREDEPQPTPEPSRSLKERFETGDHFERTLRVERRYHVRVESGLTASADGASETLRHYTVDVGEALGGVILHATLTLDRDERRALPTTEGRPPHAAPATGRLEGLVLACQLGMDGRYDCEAPDSEAPPGDYTGLVPQRLDMFPGRPSREGQTWEINGDQAASFLELPGAEVAVHFLFDSADADYGGQRCHHVSYTLEGSQPVELSGRTLPASVTGSGEYFLCRDRQVVVHHRQERQVTLAGPVIRRGSAMPVERTEDVLIEEDTSFPAP